MPLARVWSCALAGLEGEIVQVEVDIHHGLPKTTIVGLPDVAVRESKDRLYAALRNAGFNYPLARITVNLAPADVRKAGPAYDLPIALGILLASEQLRADLEGVLAVGEMALDGRLRATQGILPIAQAAWARGFRRILVPKPNGGEAALTRELEVTAAPDIGSLVSHLAGDFPIAPASAPALEAEAGDYAADLSLVRGQAHARRALEIAAAGGHNLLLSGPPGSGKTMLARSLPSILPPLSMEEALEVTAVYSVAGMLPADRALIRRRPFRSPHHTISGAGLIGGGSWPRPGEASLAHHGVLFLDELPEFEPAVMEVLRQPLEDRRVTISRAAGSATFPASFALVAARNPCPCGFHGESGQDCTCSPTALRRYRQRISGPLMDRIDMHVSVPRVRPERLLEEHLGEGSAAVRERAVTTRRVQRRRLGLSAAGSGLDLGKAPAVTCNGEMRAAEIRQHCALEAEGKQLLESGIRHLGLSARAYHRVLKLARTVADMEEAPDIRAEHVAEALQFRPRELG